MRPPLSCVLAALLGLTTAVVPAASAQSITVSDAQARSIGARIWKNECAGTVDGLTSWNAGEAFASLGINHSIWYPRGRSGPFEESFPRLVDFLAGHGASLPAWLREARGSGCPWSTREEFQRDFQGERLRGLREMLARPETIALQARFSADRLAAALPKMLDALPAAAERERVRERFARVAASPGGVYALVDYVNFKGEGTAPTERYGGRGWGLLQVLAGMGDEPNAAAPGRGATRAFVASAERTLAERVRNAPAERRESRWLPGWISRVRTYASAE